MYIKTVTHGMIINNVSEDHDSDDGADKKEEENRDIALD